MGALNTLKEALSELIAELTPGGAVRRATVGSSPITPLLYFCAFAALVAMPIGVFSKNQWLQNAAFAVFAATLGVGVAVYLACLKWRPDLLRSEGFVLSSRDRGDIEPSARGDAPEAVPSPAAQNQGATDSP